MTTPYPKPANFQFGLLHAVDLHTQQSKGQSATQYPEREFLFACT